MEKDILEHRLNINRRRFLSRLSLGIGSVALGSLLIPDLFSGLGGDNEADFIPGVPNFAPKAKRVIYLFQDGAKLGTPGIKSASLSPPRPLKRSGMSNDPKATLPIPRLNLDKNLRRFILSRCSKMSFSIPVRFL